MSKKKLDSQTIKEAEQSHEELLNLSLSDLWKKLDEDIPEDNYL
jgi:hypothetical protein